VTIHPEQINRARQIALATPCQYAEQCADPRYYTNVKPGCGVVLTVNIGEE